MIAEMNRDRAISDLRIASIDALVSPRELKRRLPCPPAVQQTVIESRRAIEGIIAGRDRRMLVVVGPCSIHDEQAALEYADRLAQLQNMVSDRLCIAMRVYFEKPRTRLGWRGLILDPHLDGSNDIPTGLDTARQLLIAIGERGLATGVEMLDPIIPQYIDDLVSWSAIGARTTESQVHREMASGLSMPVGFKNGSDGSVAIAINAFSSAQQAHSFLGIDQDGRVCVLHTTGNHAGHIILRGGRSGPNYQPQAVADASRQLLSAGLPQAVVIDCSHGNSGKQHTQQHRVFRSIIEQRRAGNSAIVGCMLESNLHPGRQEPLATQLRYGVSVTDACIGWEETEELIRWAHQLLQ